jgi:hypothetical protein
MDFSTVQDPVIVQPVSEKIEVGFSQGGDLELPEGRVIDQPYSIIQVWPSTIILYACNWASIIHCSRWVRERWCWVISNAELRYPAMDPRCNCSTLVGNRGNGNTESPVSNP